MKVQGEVREQLQSHSEKKVWNPHRLVSEKDFERNLYLIVSTYLRMKGEGKKYVAPAPILMEHEDEDEEIEDIEDLLQESRVMKV